MRYLNITSPDINNGLGCRVTLWVAGCSHHCPGCHNKETWYYEQGKELNKSTIIELKEVLDKPYIKGLTLSGGDPLAQTPKSLMELYHFLEELRKIMREDQDIWLYTGYVMDEIYEDEDKWRILDFCDYLVDGPYKQEVRDTSLAFRGSRNQNIWKKENNEFRVIEL